MSFDLRTKPWIVVHRLDDGVEEVSLLDLFRRATELRTVLGELPTQTFAIIRLLLAILHRSVGGPASPQHWAELWNAPAPPMDAIEEYLEKHRERFDLLHQATPFYQVAGLHTAKNDVFELDRLISDVPTGAQYFTTRANTGVERLSFAEAARWLVHVQAWDVSGIKSGAVGDARVTGGKGYPIGTGWSGNLGGVLVEGDTLKDTLLLNLLPVGVGRIESARDADGGKVPDRPVWEREPQTAAEEVEDGRLPTGPVDLYTWQSRRVRLHADADGVYGCLIANGDKIEPHNRFKREPMTAWRFSEPQTKKAGTNVYMPLTHDPERAIWRGLEALLPGTHHADSSSGPATRLVPGVLVWLDEALGQGLIDPAYRLLTRAIGMQYGSQRAVTDDIIDDALSMSVVLLNSRDEELGTVAINAAARADAGASALGQLAANLAEAAGGERTGPAERARELAYAELDGPFRTWLAGLGPDTDPQAAHVAWHTAAHRLLLFLGSDLVTQAGPVAWRGRWQDDKKSKHVSSPEADLWFRSRLRKLFNLAEWPRPDASDEAEETAA